MKDLNIEKWKNFMGAIVGDCVGSRFEFDNIKSKNFDLFTPESTLTDDSLMTIAVFKALTNCKEDYSDLAEQTVKCMRELGRLYPEAGYGVKFDFWLHDKNPKPYNSWGNGSAMRVSGCGFMANTLEEAEKLAEITASVTHNHPEGIKGAKATAAAVFLAKNGTDKKEIREYITKNYYPLDFTLDEIRNDYDFDVSCQGTVPPALQAFFESENFEDAIRNAVSIGGDSDTVAAVTGAVAGAYYGVPEDILLQMLTGKKYVVTMFYEDTAEISSQIILDKTLLDIIKAFAEKADCYQPKIYNSVVVSDDEEKKDE